MLRYEVLLLTVPEITEDEVKSLQSSLNQLIKKAKGSIISFERWGKYKLAYPVKKNEYGVYFLLRFEVEGDSSLLDEIKELGAIKLHDLIMRMMISTLDPHQSLAYHRAPSLEETPIRDVSSFLKEHKMEGLLSSIESGDSSRRKEEGMESQEREKQTDVSDENRAV